MSADFVFSALNHEFIVDNQPVGDPGGRTPIPLDLQDGEWVDRLFYGEIENDLVVVYQATNGPEGWGGVAGFAISPFSMQWDLTGLGFNVGLPVLEDRFVYVSSIGVVAKVDLESGTYVWKMEDLYNRNHSFGNFAPAEVGKRTVRFIGTSPYGKEPRTLVLDKTTGAEVGVHE